MIEIIASPIDIENIRKSVTDPGAGAIDIFIGTTRDNADGKKVRLLEYEAYTDMAIASLTQLVAEANQRWRLCKVAIVHRVGRVDIGEASIVIAVSSPHRKESFEACRFLIDRIKEDVPIWKKEFFEDREEWINPIKNMEKTS